MLNIFLNPTIQVNLHVIALIREWRVESSGQRAAQNSRPHSIQLIMFDLISKCALFSQRFTFHVLTFDYIEANDSKLTWQHILQQLLNKHESRCDDSKQVHG